MGGVVDHRHSYEGSGRVFGIVGGDGCVSGLVGNHRESSARMKKSEIIAKIHSPCQQNSARDDQSPCQGW